MNRHPQMPHLLIVLNDHGTDTELRRILLICYIFSIFPNLIVLFFLTVILQYVKPAIRQTAVCRQGSHFLSMAVDHNPHVPFFACLSIIIHSFPHARNKTVSGLITERSSSTSGLRRQRRGLRDHNCAVRVRFRNISESIKQYTLKLHICPA